MIAPISREPLYGPYNKGGLSVGCPLCPHDVRLFRGEFGPYGGALQNVELAERIIEAHVEAFHRVAVVAEASLENRDEA